MKSSPTTLKLLSVFALVGVTIAGANAQNIVADPGFEASADGTGAHPFSASWTVVDPSGNQPPGVTGSNSNVGGDFAFAHGGNNYANLGAFQTVGSLSQTLATTAGRSYTLSFWLANNSARPTNSFQAFFGGSLVFATASPPFTSAGNYVGFSFSNLLATSATSVLEFRYQHDDDFWRLDDIAVVVPEGGAPLWLVTPVLAGLCLLHLLSNRRHGSRS